MTHVGLGVVTIVALLAGCEDLPNCVASCKAHGACHLSDKGECAPTSNAECRASVACREHGRCTFDFGRCSSIEKRDCEDSNDCIYRGLCHPNGASGCELGASEKGLFDCQDSRNCVDHGVCGTDLIKMVCTADSSKACQASRFCLELGECTLVDKKCVVTSDADCAIAEICKKKNKCLFEHGRCVTPQ